MFLDVSRRPHRSGLAAVALTLAAIAIVVLACTPPRDTPATPQSTLAVFAVVIAT